MMNLVGLPSQVIQEMLLIKSQRYDFPLLGCANNVFLVIPSLMAESKTTIARYRASWRAMLQPGHALSVPTHVTVVQALICFLFSFFYIFPLCSVLAASYHHYFHNFLFFLLCVSLEKFF